MELEFEKPLLELEAKVAELSGMAEKSGVSAEAEIAELKKRMKAFERAQKEAAEAKAIKDAAKLPPPKPA